MLSHVAADVALLNNEFVVSHAHGVLIVWQLSSLSYKIFIDSVFYVYLLVDKAK